jgi:hypothetical protein
MFIVLHNCIDLKTPTAQGDTACDCYKRNIVFAYNFTFYEVECCRGWFDYVFPKYGLQYVISLALESEGIKAEGHWSEYGWGRNKYEFYEMVCSNPRSFYHPIPYEELIKRDFYLLTSSYFNSYYRLNYDY